MKPGQDCLWIMGGRTESNVGRIKALLTKFGLKKVTFYLHYNTKRMAQYGHFRRQRGLANSKSLEQAFYVYKGRMPSNHPKIRKFVDPGSGLFQQVMKSVPVLAPKNHAYVSKQVRDASRQGMIGTSHDEDPAEIEKKQIDEEEAASAARETGHIDPAVADQPIDAQAESAEDAAKVAVNVRKRKLYKQVLGTEVEWFPHEIDIDLVKELVWEAGSPRWVLLGTPASGAAIHGSFEMGCSVVALCADEHHMTHLLPAVVVRAVEAMANENSVVFKDDILSMRSERLNLGKLAAVPKKKQKKNLPVVDLETKEASDASASSEADAPKELPNKKVKTSPKQNPKPKKNKTVASRSSSSSSSDDSSEKPKKKGKKT
jgi:hypothetical protein